MDIAGTNYLGKEQRVIEKKKLLMMSQMTSSFEAKGKQAIL